jgi:molecular chaperone IbpA
MTTFNLAPLYRSTVGYDRIFDMLSDSIRPDWPPYNIEKMSENDYRISMAVAGFSADEIELTQHGTNLLIAGQKKADGTKHQMLHQGISSRNFKQTFSLADHVKVAAATMENGLLSIDLVREVPEALKPRTIEITSGVSKGAVPETAPVQINQESEAKRKAA